MLLYRRPWTSDRLFVILVLSILRSVKVISKLACQARVGHRSGPSIGRVGLGHKILLLEWVELGPVSKISNKYTVYTQETDYLTSIIHNDKKLYSHLLPFSYLFPH